MARNGTALEWIPFNFLKVVSSFLFRTCPIQVRRYVFPEMDGIKQKRFKVEVILARSLFCTIQIPTFTGFSLYFLCDVLQKLSVKITLVKLRAERDGWLSGGTSRPKYCVEGRIDKNTKKFNKSSVIKRFLTFILN